MSPYLATVAAIIGAVLSGILGWLDTTPTPKFDIRQFIGTILRAAISGVAAITAFIATPGITAPAGYFIAFGLGVATDAGGKRLMSAYNILTNSPSKPPTTEESDSGKPATPTIIDKRV